MSIAKTQREKKRQLGQFLTPRHIAQKLVDQISLRVTDKVLEPSMGDGAFVIPLIERFLEFYSGSTEVRLAQVLRNNVYGVELDRELYLRCLENIQSEWGCLPVEHNLMNADFFQCGFVAVTEAVRDVAEHQFGTIPFTHIVGNPPFGGTIDPSIQDQLDRRYGSRNGEKIKKETYSFFIVKSVDLLRFGGELLFICSDTFLTINTMRGLRKLLMSHGHVAITHLEGFSDETSHPMVVLQFTKGGDTDSVSVDDHVISRKEIDLTENFSWRITSRLTRYFQGDVLGDYVIASSGMTIGKNEYFVREIVNGCIVEPYEFEYFDDPITLEKERARARLGKLSPKLVERIKSQEAAGQTRRNVRIIPRGQPKQIRLPHPDYCNYNKGISEIVYAPPSHVVYWRNGGEAVLTFKKNGNWYLHGVGGQPFFKREGLTWKLIAEHLYVRYLPEGYILDSGAPCAFLRPGVHKEELYFILGWTLTRLCNTLLKEVINHTKNIQGKDFERLPYPFWVAPQIKCDIIAQTTKMVSWAMEGKRFSRDCGELKWLEEQFAYNENQAIQPLEQNGQATLRLFEPKAHYPTRQRP